VHNWETFRDFRSARNDQRLAKMNYHLFATLLGMVLQLGGAAYLVYQSRFTATKLAKYKANITYDTFASAVEDLAHEVHGQFAQQVRGFIAVAMGSLLQLYGALPS
jgi:hypothetical protein